MDGGNGWGGPLKLERRRRRKKRKNEEEQEEGGWEGG
jgi:hypothetical protein